jgi:hypothetical protein
MSAHLDPRLTQLSRAGICHSGRKELARGRRTRFRPMVQYLEDRVLLSEFYNYTLIAETGQKDQNGDELKAFSPDPSIDDAGQVAFVGTYANGQGILVGDGATLTNINPSISHTATLTFSPFVEINNNNQVVAIDRDSTDASSYVRTWSTTTTNSHQDDATGSTSSSSFDAVLANPESTTVV